MKWVKSGEKFDDAKLYREVGNNGDQVRWEVNSYLYEVYLIRIK